MLDIEIKNGFSRKVLLIGKFAFKFPHIKSWYHFTSGLAANVQERFFFKHPTWPDPSLYCPTLFSLLGLINIMPRAIPCTDASEILPFANECFEHIHLDIKNFGFLNGKIVILDYALHHTDIIR